MSAEQKFRLVTRSDFDGLVCAVLFKELDMIDDILFVHPKDMQDGRIAIWPRDITTNLPYVKGCHLAFDHHESETLRLIEAHSDNHVIDPLAPSAARVVYEHYGAQAAFPNVSQEMMAAVDKSDSAQFSFEDVLYPRGWELLNFLMDARTGLGRFRDFRISNYQLMMQLIDSCRLLPIEDILETPDVKERVALYFEHESAFKTQIQRCATVYGDLVVLDLREADPIYAGNRFMIYALYPESTISMHVLWGLKRQNTVFAIGKSIFNRTCGVNIGKLALEYEGGGHVNAGTCQVSNESAAAVLDELIERITRHDRPVLGEKPRAPASLHAHQEPVRLRRS